MKLIRLLVMFGSVLLTVPSIHAQRDWSKVEIRTERLSPTTYVIFGAGGNIGVSVGEDAVFVIDDQFAPLTKRIRAEIRKLTDKPVTFVINTHWHSDHTGGNENFGKAGALILAHDNVRKRLNSEQFIEFLRAREAPQPKAALPVVTFGADVTFHINGDEIQAIHIPNAHTDGDAIVHFKKSNVVHMGDIFFNGFYPFIDTSSGGHPDGVIAAADRVLAMSDDNTRIIPGHGPVCDKKDLRIYRDMVATVWARVQKLAKEGKSLEQILAAKPTAEFDERWGKGFIPPARFVEMLKGAVK
jgi:glyoxylase-like metal-dependent hydrolase (beta-lactamase superfamily II)